MKQETYPNNVRRNLGSWTKHINHEKYYYYYARQFDRDVLANAPLCIKKFFTETSKTADFIFSYLELHLLMIISIGVVFVCCAEVNGLHFVILVILIITLPFGRVALDHVFQIIALCLAVLIMLKMIYSTNFIPKVPAPEDCVKPEVYNSKMESILFTLDMEWLGFKKSTNLSMNQRVLYYYIIILLLMTFKCVVDVRQKIARIESGAVATKRSKVLFPNITRKQADESLQNCLKFLSNFAFYKFGVEITYILCVIVIAIRMDVYSVIYSLCLATLFSLTRVNTNKIWPLFVTLLSLAVIVQYLMILGISRKLCVDYPWNNLHTILKKWLFLADRKVRLNRGFIVLDFVVLYAAARQQAVFRLENKRLSDYPGGSNKSVFLNFYLLNFENPVPDHTNDAKSLLDVLKNLLLSLLYWATLAFEFWAGVKRVSLLSLGYLVGAFVFLWIGVDLCLWPIPKIIKSWDLMIAYSIMMLFIKSCFEIGVCIYYKTLMTKYCWLVQLLNLSCKKWNRYSSDMSYEKTECNAILDPHLYLDATCFILLILNRRFFQSYYFFHHINNVKAIVKLQARGAKLIEDLGEQQLLDHKLKEAEDLQKVKANMIKIKAAQKKLQGPGFIEPPDHDTAIRMGDYYMLDSEEAGLPSNEELAQSDNEVKRKGRGSSKRKPTISEFIGSVLRNSSDEESSTSTSKPPEFAVAATEKPPAIRRNLRKAKTLPRAGKRAKLSVIKQSVPDLASIDYYTPPPPLPPEAEKRKGFRLEEAWDFIKHLMESILVSIIKFLNRLSSDYRMVNAVMKREKQKYKERHKAFKSNQTKVPENEAADSSSLDGKEMELASKTAVEKLAGFHDSSIDLKQPLLVQLCVAVWYLLMSQTEVFCYSAIVLHQMWIPTILSLPLPLFVFLWGSLTTNRPTTTFWIVIIAYTEVTVTIKALFQNPFFVWNKETINLITPKNPPDLIGIKRQEDFATADLILLMMIFLHRYKLKTLGLWKRSNEEPTLTPENLKIYKQLPGIEASPSKLPGLMQFARSPGGMLGRMPKWKCTSRATARLDEWGREVLGVGITEIEGSVLVTYGGRRLQPTDAYATELPRGTENGNVVLRVYTSSQLHESRKLHWRMSLAQHLAPIRKFFIQITYPEWRLSVDIYPLMFFCDFVTFLIVFLAYSSFTGYQQSGPDEHFYLAENQVPLTYLTTLIVHFTMIIIDRALYLKKCLVGKLLLQISEVLIVHIWMFLIFPFVTEVNFKDLVLPQVWYVTKCIYFLLSAYQIRSGFPENTQGHFLCKNYSLFNLILFKILQFTPFFNQIRTVLDFICTKSSLTLTEWLKMESIYELVFEVKCIRRFDAMYPNKRGVNAPKKNKYCLGGLLLTVILTIVWFPILLFAVFDTVSHPNPPKSATLNLHIGSFHKIYTSTIKRENIMQFTTSDYSKMLNIFSGNKLVWGILYAYSFGDVAALSFPSESSEIWNISPEEFNKLTQAINKTDNKLHIYMSWNIYRMDDARTMVASGEFYNEISQEVREELKEMIMISKPENKPHESKRQNENPKECIFDQILPKFIQVKSDGTAEPLPGFWGVTGIEGTYRDVEVQVVTGSGSASQWFWTIQEMISDQPNLENTRNANLDKLPYANPEKIVIYTFNDKSIPFVLLFLSRRGIIGLYASLVFLTWTMLRRIMTMRYPFIMFHEMPNINPVLQLCHDIYLARQSFEFALEEDLFAKLIFLFRSPETMVRVTKIPSIKHEAKALKVK